MQVLVNIDVEDLEAGVRFYCDGLGFVLLRYLFEHSVAELEPEHESGATRVYLLQKAAGSKAADMDSARRDYARHWTPVHLDIAVDDLESARDRALAAGAQAEGSIRESGWGRLQPMCDPFGHGFCLLEFSGQGYG